MKTLLPALLVALVAGGVWAVDPVVPNPAPSIPSEAKPAMPATKNPTVRLSTSMGDVTIELYPEQAPVSVSNFLAYVDSDFYNGTVFHRVIPGFMIQGGGFTAEMGQKPTRAAIKNEADNGLLNTRGTLAMAVDATGVRSEELTDSAGETVLVDYGAREWLIAASGSAPR